MRLLARHSRSPYRDISSIVGITSNAVKVKINKMVSNDTIWNFVVFINLVIIGYEKDAT